MKHRYSTQGYARVLTALAYGHAGRLKDEVMASIMNDGRLPCMIDNFKGEVETVLAEVLRPSSAILDTDKSLEPPLLDTTWLYYSPASQLPPPFRSGRMPGIQAGGVPAGDISDSADHQAPRALKPGDVPDAQEASTVSAVQKRHISIPNAQQGKPYHHDLCGEAGIPDGPNLAFHVEGDPDGLACSREGVLEGVVEHAGPKTLLVSVCAGDTLIEELTVTLACIPDPRTLWKDLPTDPKAPYPKPDHDVRRVNAGEGWAMVYASQRGRSHAHAGKHRDDDGAVIHLENGWNILIAADGAGSCQYSRRGSELATCHLGDHLAEVLLDNTGAELGEEIRKWREGGIPSQLDGALVKLLSATLVEGAHRAYQAIEAEARVRAYSPRDFSTTLLVAAHALIDGRHVVVSFGVGDGAIAALCDGDAVTLMNQPDSGSHAGQTRFLDADLFRTRDVYSRLNIRDFGQLDALVLSTDGVTDPKFDSDNQLRDNSCWRALLAEIEPALQGHHDTATRQDPMIDYLNFFVRGHHDDRTLSVLYPLREQASRHSEGAGASVDVDDPSVAASATGESSRGGHEH